MNTADINFILSGINDSKPADALAIAIVEALGLAGKANRFYGVFAGERGGYSIKLFSPSSDMTGIVAAVKPGAYRLKGGSWEVR